MRDEAKAKPWEHGCSAGLLKIHPCNISYKSYAKPHATSRLETGRVHLSQVLAVPCLESAEASAHRRHPVISMMVESTSATGQNYGA